MRTREQILAAIDRLSEAAGSGKRNNTFHFGVYSVNEALKWVLGEAEHPYANIVNAALPSVKLIWTQILNSDRLSVWESHDERFQIQGTGRRYGNGIRRSWTLLYRGEPLHGSGQHSRLSEAKEWAQRHSDELAEKGQR